MRCSCFMSHVSFVLGLIDAALEVPQFESAVVKVVKSFFCFFFGLLLLGCMLGSALLQFGLGCLHLDLGLVLTFQEGLEAHH